MVMQLKFRVSGLQRSAGPLALAVFLGSVMGACSGTISTPTEEYPARQNDSTADEDDSDTQAAPRAPASTSNSSTGRANDDEDAAPARPPASAANDDDPAPAAADDDEALPPADEEEEAPAPAAGALSFEADIQPIFNTTCGPCHAGQATAGVDIGNDDIDVALESAREREDRVLARLEIGTMPPGCAGGDPGDPGCISAEDLADVQAWYEAGAPE